MNVVPHTSDHTTMNAIPYLWAAVIIDMKLWVLHCVINGSGNKFASDFVFSVTQAG